VERLRVLLLSTTAIDVDNASRVVPS